MKHFYLFMKQYKRNLKSIALWNQQSQKGTFHL